MGLPKNGRDHVQRLPAAGVVWLGLGLALLVIVGRIALLPVLPIPDPVIQDEFSYLLAADTFAHGRVPNPGLEYSEFFESPLGIDSEASGSRGVEARVGPGGADVRLERYGQTNEVVPTNYY